MKSIKVIKVEDAIIDEIEALGYEYETRKSVVAEMLSADMNTDTKAFETYQRELLEYKVKFEQAKREFQKMYVDPVEGATSWNLNYADKEVTITLGE